MSDPVLAEKDTQTVIATVLSRYTAATGITLAPADPRRLHLLAVVLELAQQRQQIDYAGKQNLLRYVSEKWIADLAELWEEELLPAQPSKTTLRFVASAPGILTIGAGKRGTDGKNLWAVIADTTSEPSATFVDAVAECTVEGSATNQVPVGFIDTLVDSIPGIASVSNITETAGGRDIETTEAFRERLRSEPEAKSPCGPRLAYEANAMAASASVADASALGIDDAGNMTGTAPTTGQVLVLLLEGTRDDDGNLTAVVPDPSSGLLTTVGDALSGEDVRPFTDHVIIQAPLFVDADLHVTYHIARSRSRSAIEIQAAVAEAFAAYQLWQQSKIGRDIDPGECDRLIRNAGAKRTVISTPAYTPLTLDQSARFVYVSLHYGGIESD
jgi:phage-related baseplate assembly protein